MDKEKDSPVESVLEEIKHTPPPWTIAVVDKTLNLKEWLASTVDRTIEHGGYIKDFFVVLSPESKEGDAVYTAIVGNGPTSEANARLIALAPQLMEENKKLRLIVQEHEKEIIQTRTTAIFEMNIADGTRKELLVKWAFKEMGKRDALAQIKGE